jgi:hypothetical protein
MEWTDGCTGEQEDRHGPLLTQGQFQSASVMRFCLTDKYTLQYPVVLKFPVLEGLHFQPHTTFACCSLVWSLLWYQFRERVSLSNHHPGPVNHEEKREKNFFAMIQFASIYFTDVNI